jgi:UDP-N-acetylmuramoyl-tripeptide--D-alanyl-D-alanine ligase
MPGMHNVLNCLAACAAMVAAGAPLERVLPGLAKVKPLPMRLVVRPLAGVTLIDDCYNANPQSVRAGLGVLSAGTQPEHRIAFLGDMLELGDQSARLHEELGRELAGIVSRLVVVGPMGEHTANGAIEAGMAQDRVRRLENSAQARDAAFDLIRPGDTILVKGSRAMAMELVSQEIIKRYAENTNQPG